MIYHSHPSLSQWHDCCNNVIIYNILNHNQGMLAEQEERYVLVLSILGGCSKLLGSVSSTSLLQCTLGWVLSRLW